MKNFLCLLVCFLILSCNNDEDENLSNDELIGKWEWVQSTGGDQGETSTPTSTEQISLLSSRRMLENYTLMEHFNLKLVIPFI